MPCAMYGKGLIAGMDDRNENQLQTTWNYLNHEQDWGLDAMSSRRDRRKALLIRRP